VEVPDDLDDAARVSGADKGDCERGHSLEDGDGPLLPLRELEGVPRVLGEEVDEERRSGGALARVRVVEDLGGHAGLVQDYGEVRDLGGLLGLDVDILALLVDGWRLGRRRRLGRLGIGSHGRLGVSKRETK
jgi:hypothetical protein